MAYLHRLIFIFIAIVPFWARADFGRPATYLFNGKSYPDAAAACKAVDPSYPPAMGVEPSNSSAETHWTGMCLRPDIDSGAPANVGSHCPDIAGRTRVARTPGPIAGRGVTLGTDICNYSGSDPDGGPGDNEKCNGLQQWCTDKKGFATLFKGKGQSADFFCHAAEKFIAGGGGGGSSWEPEFPGCEKGCMVISGGTTVSVKDDGGQWWTEGTGKYVGSTCDPNVINKLNEGTPDEKEVTPPGTKDPGKCNGQPGTVNGVAVCLPYGEAEGDKKTDTTVNSDGSRTKTETVTKCNGGQCTTTTTTTKIDKDGNVSGGGSSTSTVPQGDYCARNPASAVCKALDPSKPPGSGTGGTGGTGSGDGGGDDDTDKSSFGGSCAGGWTCEGDAIQCAVAREQHKRACELFEDRDNEAYKLYDKERDKEGSVLGALKGNKDIDVSQYVNDRDDFIGSGSCPADKVIPFSYGEVTIPYSRICPYAEMLGTVLIICAGIAGARIITRRDS